MNIYNRPFDDQSQVKIRMETMAINALLKLIKGKKYTMLLSFMLDYENSLNPCEDVRMKIEMMSRLATEHIDLTDDILITARSMALKGIKPRDAMHLACADNGQASWFITCDDKLVKKGRFMDGNFNIVNPVDFIRSEVK